MPDTRPEPDAETYVRLLAEHERSLETYVHGLMRRAADAEDVLQECKLVLWKQFDRYEPGTNFLAWARKIALNLILNHRRKEERREDAQAARAEIRWLMDRLAEAQAEKAVLEIPM